MKKEELKKRGCTCEEWITLVSQLETIFTMAWAHGYHYKGKEWLFCPWCGEKLK